MMFSRKNIEATISAQQLQIKIRAAMVEIGFFSSIRHRPMCACFDEIDERVNTNVMSSWSKRGNDANTVFFQLREEVSSTPIDLVQPEEVLGALCA